MLTRTIVLTAGVLAAFTATRASADPAKPAAQTEPFVYSEDFESGNDPVQFWMSYEKKYTVNYKGVTEERACSGRRSFKLDVTFDESSRFLWQIPMPAKVPVGGKLTFTGHLLIGAGTTAEAALGVSFALPPTHHGGCTAPYTSYTSTDGEWKSVGGDFVQRSRDVAGNIAGHFHAGLRGENLGVMLERIILDLRGKAGDRVVLYVDDLEIRGVVPTADAFQAETAARWAPAKAAFDQAVASWDTQLRDAEQKLVSLTGLSPRAREFHQDLLMRIRKHRDKLRAIDQRGYMNRAEKPELDSFVAALHRADANIRAISASASEGREALLYVVAPISALKILPHDKYLCGRIASEVAVTAARGEYEPASFVVYAIAELAGLRVTVSALRHGDSVIPAANVDVKGIKCWYQAGTAWAGIRQDKTTRLLTPELLLNDDTLVKVDYESKENYLKLRFPDGDKYIWISDPTAVRRGQPWPVDKYPLRDSPSLLPVDIPAGTNKQFWLTVRVPEKARAGAYTGEIVLSTATAAVAELTLRVNVLPFELLPPYYTSSMDYHGRLDSAANGMISSWLKNREQFRNELANMVAHGLRNCQHYNIKKEMLGEVLTIRADVGMDNRTLYLKNTIPIGNPTDPDALATIRRDVRDIIEFVKDYGTEEVYFYGMDERRGEELASQRLAWTAVREAGGKIFVAGGADNIRLMGDIQDMHVRAGRPSREEVDKWHALGHRIFCYANPQTGVENPVVYRRNFGLLLWQYDYDGASTNAYQHTFGVTWNDFDHPVYRAHTIAYPTANGVIDTIAWEGYREAVDDVRYITTLQEAVETAGAARNAKREHAVAAARDLLQRLKTGTEIDTADLDALRAEIIDRLLELERTQ